jgi:hypothetical protein
MHFYVIWALVVFETHFMRDALVALSGVVVLGAGAAIIIIRKRDKDDKSPSGLVEKKTETVQKRDELVKQQTLDTLLSAVESGCASLDPQMGLSAQPIQRTDTGQAAPAVSAELPAQANGGEAQKERRRAPWFAGVDTEGLARQSPWWIANGRPSATDAQAAAPKDSSARPAANGEDTGAREATETAGKNGASNRLPRLTELRGTMFSTGIKELDLARNGAEPGAGIERLKGPLPSLEALLDRTRKQSGADLQAAQVNELLAAPKAETAPEHEVWAGDVAGQPAAAEPQLQAPKPAKAARKLDKDAREPYDRVEILPSRRGQYKRKDR